MRDKYIYKHTAQRALEAVSLWTRLRGHDDVLTVNTAWNDPPLRVESKERWEHRVSAGEHINLYEFHQFEDGSVLVLTYRESELEDEPRQFSCFDGPSEAHQWLVREERPNVA